MNKKRFLRTRSGAVIDLRLYVQCYYRDIVRVQKVVRRYLAIGRARMKLMKKKFNRVVEDQQRAIKEEGEEKEEEEKKKEGLEGLKEEEEEEDPLEWEGDRRSSSRGTRGRSSSNRSSLSSSSPDVHRLGPRSEDVRHLTTDELADLLVERVELNDSLCSRDAMLGVGKKKIKQQAVSTLPNPVLEEYKLNDSRIEKKLQIFLDQYLMKVRKEMDMEYEESLIVWKALQMDVMISQTAQVLEDMLSDDEEVEVEEEKVEEKLSDDEEVEMEEVEPEEVLLLKQWSKVKPMLKRGKIQLDLDIPCVPRPLYPGVLLLTGPLWNEFEFGRLVMEVQEDVTSLEL